MTAWATSADGSTTLRARYLIGCDGGASRVRQALGIGLSDYGFDERGSSLLMGQAMESEIANVVDPEFTIVAKMRKRYLKSQQ